MPFIHSFLDKKVARNSDVANLKKTARSASYTLSLPDLLKNPKAMQAFMKMKKPDIAELELAAQS